MTTLDPQTGLSQLENDATYDVIVLGAGAGGMAAAFVRSDKRATCLVA